MIKKALFFCWLVSYLVAETGLITVAENFDYKLFKEVVNKPILYKNGILFTYLAKGNEEVYLSGSFDNWQEKIKFLKSDLGISYLFFKKNLKKGDYRYRFLVNGIWQNDPEQTKISLDFYGNKLSTFSLGKDYFFSIKSPIKLTGNYYRFYLKDKNYREVYWLGDENRWEKGKDKMYREGEYWVLEKLLFATRPLYIFWADGEYFLDAFNNATIKNSFSLTVNFFDKE